MFSRGREKYKVNVLCFSLSFHVCLSFSLSIFLSIRLSLSLCLSVSRLLDKTRSGQTNRPFYRDAWTHLNKFIYTTLAACPLVSARRQKRYGPTDGHTLLQSTDGCTDGQNIPRERERGRERGISTYLIQ